MAKHEFGIMESAPISEKRYDEYEPKKYNCIAIDDDYIEGIQDQLLVVDSFGHTVDIPIDPTDINRCISNGYGRRFGVCRTKESAA